MILAKRYQSWLSGANASGIDKEKLWTQLSDAADASVGRSHFGYRAGLVFGDADHLDLQLAALATNPALSAVSTSQPKIGFLFTGQGSQWVGMGLSLYQREPVCFARCWIAVNH